MKFLISIFCDKMNVIIILGCQLVKRKGEFQAGELLIERLEKALELYRQLPEKNTFIVVSGGFGKKPVSESYVMKKWLMDHNVDANMIAEEDRSISTVQNFYFSKFLLDTIKHSYQINISHIYVVSSDFHMQRAEEIANAKKTFEAYKDVPITYLGSETQNREEFARRLEHEKFILEKFFS